MARKTTAKTTAANTNLRDDDNVTPTLSKRRARSKQVDTIPPDDAPLNDMDDDIDEADDLDDFDAYSAQDDDAQSFTSADFTDTLNNGDYDELLDEFDEAYEDEFGHAPKHKRRSASKKSRRLSTAETLPAVSPAQAIVPAMPTALTAPGVNLGAYINAVHQIPILTPEQEQELAHRYTDEGDLEAARLLVMSHLRFVIHIARSYSGYGLPQGDLIQEGNVGLMKAVKRFDPNKGVRLVSFAVHWIKAEIHEFVIRNWRIVKVATTKAHRKLFFNLRSLKKTNNQLTLEEAEAIAKDLNVTVKQVLEMESRLTSYDASFEAQSDDEDEGRYAPQYYLEDEANPADLVEDADWEQSNNAALQQAMLTLDDRSRDIVQQRWLNEQKSTLHELAAEYNISAERVRQIEKNAMDKIREAMLANTHLQLDLE